MLTIKSRFTNFYNRQGSEVSAADLDILKQLISPDLINFRGNISYGFSESIAKAIVARIAVSKTAKICLQNDTSFHLYLELLKAGFDPANIYIAVGKWHVSGKTIVSSKTDSTYIILKRHAAASFNEEINIIELKEIFNMKFDLIIANPPYGKIGAMITDKIRSDVSYTQYINLLPANDYKRVSNLHQYVRNMKPVNNGFEDAAVTTHLCEVVQNANNMTVEEFEISQYIDPQLDKYFRVLRDRQDYELIYTTNTPIDKIKTLDISKTVILGAKDVNHRHLPYSKNCVQYKWNVEESVDAAWVEANYACKSSGKTGQTSLFVVYLASAEEKQALVNLLYGATGFKLIQKLWTAINVDSYCMPNKYLPKVKLYTGITWEEILEEYGYTAEEITAVMEDLNKFKGMEV